MTVTVSGAPRCRDEAPSVSDVALAVGLAVFAALDLRFNLDNSAQYGSNLDTAVVVGVSTLSLIWRRRYPLAVLTVVVAAVALPELVTVQTVTLWGHFVPLLVAAYSVARWDTPRAMVLGAVMVVLGLGVAMVRVPSVGTASNIPFTLVPVCLALVAGRSMHQRADRAQHLEAREAERQAHVAAAVEEERSRIARELHDIVSHCVSVMVVQAGASEELMTRDPDRARESMRVVQETGHQAVAELGRMLGVLRGRPDGSPSGASTLAPQPGTGDLSDLAERVSGLGVPVQLTVSGNPRTLPPGLDLTAYRVVQEALTNAVKHAGRPAKAHVEIRYWPQALDIDIVDDGHTPPSGATAGHGLIGMAERVAVYGGRLEAGARAEGGFRVHVTLPLEAS